MPVSGGRAYTATRFLLELEGEFAGSLSSVAGGEIFAEVVTDPPLAGRAKKHLEGLRCTAVRVEFGSGISQGLFDWVVEALSGQRTERDGAVVLVNYRSTETARLEFTGARVTEVVLPSYTATARDASEWSLTFQPQTTTMSYALAGAPQTRRVFPGEPWLACNYSLSITGLEQACSHVSEIAALAIRQPPEPDSPPQVGVIELVIPNVALPAFEAWHHQFVVEGHNSDQFERSATLRQLSPSLQKVLCTVELHNIGIVRITPERLEDASQVIARSRIELYAEAVELVDAKFPLLAAGFESQQDPERHWLAPQPWEVDIDPPLTEVAHRLLASTRTRRPAGHSLPRRRQGTQFGEVWAKTIASAAELEALAAIADRDWTALRLADDHSLVHVLSTAGHLVADAGHVELARDEFLEGLVTGAAAVYRDVQPLLARARREHDAFENQAALHEYDTWANVASDISKRRDDAASDVLGALQEPRPTARGLRELRDPAGFVDFTQRYGETLLPDSLAVLATLNTLRPQAGAAPAEPWALGGCVLTPHAQINPGWVVVDGDKIALVSGAKPAGILCVETDGVILPGLIDLHGHPEWNVFPAWEPPHTYTSRYQWQQSPAYLEFVKDPMDKLKTIQGFAALLSRYAEIRALVGGTTAIQGATAAYPLARQQVVRHVDLAPFGEARSASEVFPLKPEKAEKMKTVKAGIESGQITSFYTHICEGTNQESAAELETLNQLGLLTPATVLIHGTALHKRQLAKVRDVGARLIWSPQSNLRLYGDTTRAAAARQLGIPLSLGADWLPSGSVGLLAEMQVARHALAHQGQPITPKELVTLVTSGAAQVALLQDHLGHLEAGRPADILVLERHEADPYEAVCHAEQSSVELVVIDGRLLYGRDDWFDTLAPNATVYNRSALDATGEIVWAWGKQMRLDVATPPDLLGDLPPLPRLQQLRTAILAAYPQAGPIFA